MKHTPLILIGLGLLLLGAACGKRTSTNTNTVVRNTNVARAVNTAITNTASSLDPCTLLTPAEAAAVFGRAGKTPTRTGPTCRYDTDDSTKFFDLTAKSGTAADFTSMQALCDRPDQPVSGLGQTSCAANNTVVGLKNGYLITLIAGGVFDQGQLQNLAVTAAQRIL